MAAEACGTSCQRSDGAFSAHQTAAAGKAGVPAAGLGQWLNNIFFNVTCEISAPMSAFPVLFDLLLQT